MKKLYIFMKEYWFGFFISLILLFGFLFFLLVLVSPRYDLQKRGFIPCTETMAKNIMNCPEEKKFLCGIKAVLKNSWCDLGVIKQGFSLWFDGKQKTPWDNYIFEPVLPEDAFFENDVDRNMNMEQIKKLNEFMEMKDIKQNKDVLNEKTK